MKYDFTMKRFKYDIPTMTKTYTYVYAYIIGHQIFSPWGIKCKFISSPMIVSTYSEVSLTLKRDPAPRAKVKDSSNAPKW